MCKYYNFQKIWRIDFFLLLSSHFSREKISTKTTKSGFFVNLAEQLDLQHIHHLKDTTMELHPQQMVTIQHHRKPIQVS
jgi:hypothetical protein